jgi:hypothetical protein
MGCSLARNVVAFLQGRPFLDANAANERELGTDRQPQMDTNEHGCRNGTIYKEAMKRGKEGENQSRATGSDVDYGAATVVGGRVFCPLASVGVVGPMAHGSLLILGVFSISIGFL